MTSKYSSMFIIINVFVFCDSGIVDTLTKCELKDEDCHKEFMHTFLNRIAKDGAQELEIPPIDPMSLKNITVEIVDFIKITLVEGTVTGMKDCIIEKYIQNIEKQRIILDIICDATTEGKYKMFAQNPIVKSLVGSDTVHGEGNGNIRIVKLKLKMVFPFSLTKRNEELFLTCKRKAAKYDFDVLGTMIFTADKLYIGEVESSKLVTEILNQSWQFLMPSFGRPFMDKVLEYVTIYVCQFHDNVPTKYYITDDLSSYLE